MRELQLTDAASGIADTFEDIHALSAQCRFGNCRHESEPGCVVRDAIENGRLDPARLLRWRKLLAEDSFNSASLAERRTRERAFGKMVRQVMKESKSRRRP
jgi:ribosome biogenesis GTPase